MRILMIRPMENPVELEIDHTLDAIYEALECRMITAIYPWEDEIALVTDDEGLLAGKPHNRYIPEIHQPIVGSFFLCGLSEDSFGDLPDALMQKYKQRFWKPEIMMRTEAGVIILSAEDNAPTLV